MLREDPQESRTVGGLVEADGIGSQCPREEATPHRDPRDSLYLDYVGLFSDQIVRRILRGEKIPHQEKVFSIFKPFTRWIVKGKAGILQELGVPVAVVNIRLFWGMGFCGTKRTKTLPWS